MRDTSKLLKLTTKYAQVLELGTSERTINPEDRRILERYKEILNHINKEAWFWNKDSRALDVINKILSGQNVSPSEKEEAIDNIKDLGSAISIEDFVAVISRY